MPKQMLENTNIAVKAGFTSVLVLVLIFGVFALYQLKTITDDMTNTIATNSQKIVHVVLMREAIHQRQIILTKMLLMDDIFEREESRMSFYDTSGVFREEKDRLLKLPINDSENKLLNKILIDATESQPTARKTIDALIENYARDEMRGLILSTQATQKRLYDALGVLINLQNENTQNFVKLSRDKYATTLYLSILFGAIIFLVAWLIAKITAKIITQKNEELVVKNKQLEEVSNQALEATRTKSEFLAVMSHEIRTPLTSIIGFAEALSDDHSKHKDDRLNITKTIIKNGNHLLTIINDILDISKIEANRMNFEKNGFSPVELVTDVEEVIKNQFKEKGIQLYVEYDFPLPNIICNDALRIKQVILNLCSNAFKFTKAGEVCIKIHCDIEGEKIFFNIIDSGIGLTDKQIDKIFDAFTQADSSTTRKYGGTGLGLSLSKRFAEKMGGTITVKSLQGIGSQFCVSISTGKIDPQQLIAGESELPEKIDHIKHQYDYSCSVKGSILIVEDNYDNQQLLSILLSDIGAELTFADNGQQAIDKTLNNTYDLIFMDMQMPVMGGLEATKLLREAHYKNPIIALTANAMKSDYDMCIAAGCNGFLTKPINKEKLFQAVYKYLEIKDEVISEVFDKRSRKMQELIIKFVNSLPEKLDKVEKLRDEKKWNDIRSEIHKIKGVGTSMGYPVVTDIAAEIEQEALKENEVEVDKLLLKMKDVCEQARKNIPELISEHKE